jgi:hypothetical protein
MIDDALKQGIRDIAGLPFVVGPRFIEQLIKRSAVERVTHIHP